MDENFKKLAKVLCGHSVSLKAGEHLIIDAAETPEDMVIALIEEAAARGAHPHVEISNGRISRKLSLVSEDPRLKVACDSLLYKYEKMHAYIAIRGAQNIFENSDVPNDQMKRIMTAMRPVSDYRINKLKWVVLRWPTPSMAQQAAMSSEAFADFYFKVCTYDYSRMADGMAALKTLMEATDKVHIRGAGTDLTFSIKGMRAISCGGQFNIPDGEVFTAPVKTSVNGHISYNAPTVYNGISFDGVRLEFKDGKIVSASASSNEEDLKKILSTDEGASYVGEFALGFNPHIKQPMRDILFDEKIAGSFHFTPGQAYAEADNGNVSKVHWDLVSMQTPEHGGGEIWFDGILIRKDGKFLIDGADKLNPENLLS